MSKFFASVIGRDSAITRLLSALVFLGMMFLNHGSIAASVAKAQDDVGILISNDQFVFHPRFYGFDLQEFLESQPGILKDFHVEIGRETVSAADLIESTSYFYSLNPQVLLALLEAKSSLVSDAYPSLSKIETAMGVSQLDADGFAEQLDYVAAQMFRVLYSNARTDSNGLTSLDEVAATLALRSAFSHSGIPEFSSADDEYLEIQRFIDVFTEWFGDPTLDRISTTATISSAPEFHYPWPAGGFDDGWKETQGPHDCGWPLKYENTEPLESCDPRTGPFTGLDFTPPHAKNIKTGPCYGSGDETEECREANRGIDRLDWVIAAAPGSVVYSGFSQVVVWHEDSPEWGTLYYHIATELRASEGPLPPDLHIGHPSSECNQGGSSTQSHVHFSILYGGVFQNARTFVNITDHSLAEWGGAPPRGVTLYEHADYQGASLRLTSTDPDLCDNPLDPSQPPVDPCFSAPSWNDIASSIEVMPGYKAWLYLHSERQERELGEYNIFRDCGSDIQDFSAPEWNFPNGASLNDNVSRVIVANCPPGGSTQGLSIAPASTDDPCAPDPPRSTTDSATFLSDITLPDGSVVSPGQALVKIWRVRNSGSSTWSGYKLKFVGGEQMGGPAEAAIPTTAPGETVDLSINLTAPSAQGAHSGSWQIVNPSGGWVNGGQVWVSINVQPQSSNITLSADPPSPASADQVRVHARVDNFPNLRAMRVLVDGAQLCELGAPEITDCTWHTDGYAPGQHTIVAEVDDWSGPAWGDPVRRSLVYELTGGGAVNHAPARPTPTSPYDWYVYYSGNTAQLCAQANGDPDGDPITGYYFDVYESAQLWNSGWVGSNCVTTGPLGPYTYKWRVKVRDSGGAESDWSDSWHFTLVNPNLEITELYFEPQDGSSEQVKIRACTAGQGGVGITMRVSVNDASDGSGNGEWHIIKELGVPCFNAEDAPIWPTLEYGDGPHRVRAEAHGADASWDGAAVREEVYTLPHRRPAGPRLVAPVPPSGDIHEAITLNSRTVTFRWESTIRAGSYTLHISTNPSPKDDPNPVFRQTFAPSVTEYTLTLGQDYPILYWQVSAANDVGTNASGDQLFGIDRVAPSCTVQSLPGTTYESVFQVNWGGSDNLAGVRGFDIQYLDSERGTWNDWLTGVPAAKSYELFTGQPGHSYAFRCRATDNADNSGDYPSSPDTSIIVDPTARPQTPWWDTAYGEKRNLTILNNMPGTTLPAGYPVHLHFDSGTTPTAAELYNASQSSPKCNDLRLVYNDTTELDRVMQNCSSSAIDIWFRTQISIAAGTSDSTAHQLYYGNPSAGGPPGSPTTVFDPPLDANTVGLWYMDEGGGSTLHDYSAYNNHCSIDPTTTWVTPAKFSGALHFLGGTHGPSVNCGTSSTFNLQTFTFEMFLKRTGTAWGRLAGHLGDNQNRWLMTLNGNGTIRVSIWPCPTCGGEEFNGSMPIGDTVNWHHVAFSLQNSTLKIYVDGQLDSTHQVVWGNIRSGTPPLTLGSAENIERAFAEMSHVRLSNIARTSFPYGSSAAITNEPSLAAGDPVAPPITGSSDLAVLSLATYPNPGGGLLAEAIVQNQGDLSTQNGFYTDLYLDHLPTGAGDYTGSIQFWVNDPIAPAAVVTLTTVITDLPGLGGAGLSALHATGEITGTLYAQVDSTGGVGEPDEANNIYDAGTQVCVAPSDDYEPDDSASEATVLPLGASQSHNLSTLADQDWFEIDVAEAGREYVITTNDLDLNADTYLYLYDTDGTTLLAANDDYGGTLASQIAWTPTAPGTYYVVVKHWNPNVGGCGTTYTLSLIEGQSFQLNSGWNLVSYRVEPAVPDLPPVLSTIDGRYDRVLGETGVYAPDLPDAYNTLHELHAGLGYYLRVTDAVGPGLLVAGTTLPASSPIPLHEGWNWVGYLPPTTLPITAALQSIEGHYQRVLSLDEVYDPSLPEFSTLWEMEPGQGYLIYMTDSVSLVYPTGSGATARSALESGGPGCEAVSPTPFLTLVYGQIEVNGDPAPVGTRVEAITPREEVAGCFVVHHPGLFGLMHVYGEDATAEPPIAGFRAGEALAFRVNGAPADASTGVLWQDDRMPHTTVLSATVSIAPGGDIYLPLILKGE